MALAGRRLESHWFGKQFLFYATMVKYNGTKVGRLRPAMFHFRSNENTSVHYTYNHIHWLSSEILVRKEVRVKWGGHDARTQEKDNWERKASARHAWIKSRECESNRDRWKNQRCVLLVVTDLHRLGFSFLFLCIVTLELKSELKGFFCGSVVLTVAETHTNTQEEGRSRPLGSVRLRPVIMSAFCS